MFKKPIEISKLPCSSYYSILPIFFPLICIQTHCRCDIANVTLVSFYFCLEVYFTSSVESGSIWNEQAENRVWVQNAPWEERVRLEGALGCQFHIAFKPRADFRAHAPNTISLNYPIFEVNFSVMVRDVNSKRSEAKFSLLLKDFWLLSLSLSLKLIAFFAFALSEFWANFK